MSEEIKNKRSLFRFIEVSIKRHGLISKTHMEDTYCCKVFKYSFQLYKSDNYNMTRMDKWRDVA